MSSPSYSCPRLHDTGSELCSIGPSPPNSPTDVVGLKASKKRVRPLDDYIIKSSSGSQHRKGYPGSGHAMDLGTILNPQEAAEPMPTSGKKRLQSLVQDSNSEPKHLEETFQQIGIKYFCMQRREILAQFPLTCKYVIIGKKY